MKTKFFEIFNRQIIFLLSILGFSLACNQCAAQYGVPIGVFEIKGFIKSENAPIRNIRVIIENDTTYSDTNGYYYLKVYEQLSNEIELLLNFTDIDGKENGSYIPQKTKVLFKLPEQLKIVDIEMKKE